MGSNIHSIAVSELPSAISSTSAPPPIISSSSSLSDLTTEERLIEDDIPHKPIPLPVEQLPESALLQIRSLYSSLLLLAEDACNAAAYLYTVQPLFPTYFNPDSPFTSTEWLLLSGNVALRPFPFPIISEEKEENQNKIEEINPLTGLNGHFVEDPRPCDLCGQYGDNVICGRMLCNSTSEWVHLNCVYYSSGITIDDKSSSIQKYTIVKNRSRSVQCYICKKSGASIKCNSQGCNRCFHFACGHENGCFIRVNKEAFCQHHRPSTIYHSNDESFIPFMYTKSSMNKSSNHFNSSTFQRVQTTLQDCRLLVSSLELFTTRFNHRVVFFPQRF